MVTFPFQVLLLYKNRKGIEKERWKIKVTLTAGAIWLLSSTSSFKVLIGIIIIPNLLHSQVHTLECGIFASHTADLLKRAAAHKSQRRNTMRMMMWKKKKNLLLGWIPVLLNRREAREVVKGPRQMKKERPSPPVKYHQKYKPREWKRCVWGGMEQEQKLKKKKNFTHFQSPKYLHRHLGRKNNNKMKKKP